VKEALANYFEDNAQAASTDTYYRLCLSVTQSFHHR